MSKNNPFKKLVIACKSFEGLTLGRLGKEVGTSQSHLSGILSGKQSSVEVENNLVEFVVETKKKEFKAMTTYEPPKYFEEGVREFAKNQLQQLREQRL